MLSSKAAAYRKMPAMNEGDKEETRRLHPGEVENGTVVRRDAPPHTPQWKLLYEDFIPELYDYDPKDEKTHKQEQFGDLLRNAQQWIKKRTDARVLTCETVTWTYTKSSPFHDTETVILTRSLEKEGLTCYLRGLRLWLVPPAANQDHLPQTIGYRDFLPKTAKTVKDFVNNINRELRVNPIPGRIMKIETLPVLCRADGTDAEAIFWSEQVGDEIRYALAIRIFYTKCDSNITEIGIKDFYPRLDEDGYETFAELMVRGDVWIHETYEGRITNVQSVGVSKTTDSPIVGDTSCYYTESLSADRALSQRFLRILRVAYVRHEKNEPSLKRISYKTITPMQFFPDGEDNPPDIEKLPDLIHGLTEWLTQTGAEVFCVETIPTRTRADSKHELQTEVTLSSCHPEDGSLEDRLLVHVRIYLNGAPPELLPGKPKKSVTSRGRRGSQRRRHRFRGILNMDQPRHVNKKSAFIMGLVAMVGMITAIALISYFSQK